MAETQQTMTEFTYATGETGIVGDRFSPSVVLFWLRTSVAASSMRVIYKSPNTLLGVIPLGSSTQTIPLVVPEKLRTLDHGRPWSDDQFASTRLSSNRDMSR